MLVPSNLQKYRQLLGGIHAHRQYDITNLLLGYKNKESKLKILSRGSVTKTRVWIGELVYCIFSSRNYS
jgi:hypothetical protein